MKPLFSLVVLTFLSLHLMAQPKNKMSFEPIEEAPMFKVSDQFGEELILEEILKKSKVLLVFYRGSWCPYCKKHMAMIQKNLEEINESGTKVIVVTPEKPEFISRMTEQTENSFSIVHDEDGQLMKDYRVNFEVNKENVPKFYNLTMKNAIAYNSEETGSTLPIPATFVINQKRTFDYIHFDPDYKNRSSFEEIIKHLKTK